MEIQDAYKNDPKREFQDKADIQSLLATVKNLDFNLIKEYADFSATYANQRDKTMSEYQKDEAQSKIKKVV